MKINDVELRTIIYQKGWTQSRLAKETGMSRPYISSVCRGLTCSEATVQKIADALGVNLEELKA